MLRSIPRSLAHASRYNSRPLLQCRSCGGATITTSKYAADDTLATSAGTRDVDISSLTKGYADLALGAPCGANQLTRLRRLPEILGVRAMSSKAAAKKVPEWKLKPVIPYMKDGEDLPPNLKLAEMANVRKEQEGGDEAQEEEINEAEAAAGEAEDDAEAAALESTLPSVTKPSQPSNLSAKKDRSVYDGPFVHGFKGTDVPVVCWATGATVETKALDPDVFGVPIRRDVVHDVIRWQLSKRRAGNAKTKRIGEIRGSGKKLRPQKGQGRARVGHSRPPHFRGGAKAHGPRIRDWSYKLNKKFIKMGLRCALSARLMEGKLKVVDHLQAGTFSTSSMLKTMKARGVDQSVMFIDKEWPSREFYRSTTNIGGVKVLPARGANVYDIIKRDEVVITVDGVAHLEQALKPL